MLTHTQYLDVVYQGVYEYSHCSISSRRYTKLWLRSYDDSTYCGSAWYQPHWSMWAADTPKHALAPSLVPEVLPGTVSALYPLGLPQDAATLRSVTKFHVTPG